MLVMNLVIFLLVPLVNLIHGFSVERLKRPPTSETEECPPGIWPCVEGRHADGPKPTQEKVVSPTKQKPTNTTSGQLQNLSMVSSHPKNQTVLSAQISTTKVPSQRNMTAGRDTSSGESRHVAQLCPPGIWVCLLSGESRRQRKKIR